MEGEQVESCQPMETLQKTVCYEMYAEGNTKQSLYWLVAFNEFIVEKRLRGRGYRLLWRINMLLQLHH
jgi:hypothetical protein